MDLSVCGMSYTYIVSCICRIMLGCRPLSSLVSGQESTQVKQIRYMESDTLISNAQIPLVYPVENLVADPGFWPGFRQVRASLRRAHGKFANFCVCDQVWDLAFDWIDKWNFGLRVNGARCQSRRSAENEVPCRTLQRRMGDTIVSKSSHTHTHTHTHTPLSLYKHSYLWITMSPNSGTWQVRHVCSATSWHVAKWDGVYILRQYTAHAHMISHRHRYQSFSAWFGSWSKFSGHFSRRGGGYFT